MEDVLNKENAWKEGIRGGGGDRILKGNLIRYDAEKKVLKGEDQKSSSLFEGP